MNGLETKSEKDLSGMLKSGNAFSFFSGFEKSKAVEIQEDGTTKKFIEFDASSDREDLAGDAMEVSALEDMAQTAVGTIMLRDHNRSTDKIFGQITDAKIVKENGKTILRMKAEVDDEDPANVRIWKSIKKGIKIGASVTVVILEKKNHPSRKDSLIISRCYLLEVSIVTIPCNQDAWTIAATASKALALLAENPIPNQFNPVFNAENSINKEEIMLEEKEKGVDAENVDVSTESTTDSVEETASGETQPEVVDETTESVAAETEPEARAEKSFFPRTLATILAVKSAMESGQSLTVEKGLFNDILNQKPSLWKLYDILSDVKWRLCSQKWALEQAGVTDFSELITAWDEALQEFCVAAKDSFLYWGDFPVVVEVEDDDLELASPEAIAIQKSFDVFAEVLKKEDAKTNPTLQQVAKDFVSAAKSAGLLPDNQEVVVSAIPGITDEFIRQSQLFTDLETRTKAAEEELETVKKELDVAKVSLEAAAEVIEEFSQEPLPVHKA